MPQPGIDALADMRVVFRDLRSQIDAIDSSDSAKQLALDGLDQLDRAIGAYERGLEFGYSRGAIRKHRKADQVGSDAVDNLRQAKKGLAT